MQNVNLENRDFSNTQLSGSDLSNSNLSGTKLNGSDLSNSNLSGTKLPLDLRNVKMQNVNLENRDFSNTQLSGSDLSNSNLSGATLPSDFPEIFKTLPGAYSKLFRLFSADEKSEMKELKLELLYRGSRDGFNAQSFHQKCDNKGATLTLIETTNQECLGGFTRLPWRSSGGYIKGNKSDAFLFWLGNKKGQDLEIKYELNNMQDAMFDNSSHGPTFGGGHDLHINNNMQSNSNYYYHHSYQLGADYKNRNDPWPSNQTKFTVVEIEVFSVING